MNQGRARDQAVSRWPPTAAARVRARVWQVGFVVDKMAPGHVFSEYFGFPCQPHFIPPTSPSSQSPGTGTIGQYMAAVPSGPNTDSTSHNSNKEIRHETTVFTRSFTGTVVSNPTRGMDVSARLFCVCIVLAIG
jgi:hypothetical protein